MAGLAELVAPKGGYAVFDEERRHAFGALCELRRELSSPYRKAEAVIAFAEQELHRERALLVVAISLNLFDGTAELEARGYLNTECFPPWDTWLDLVDVDDTDGEPCLLCWVPQWAVNLVNLGIRVDPAECASWTTWDRDTLEVVGWGLSGHSNRDGAQPRAQIVRAVQQHIED